MNKTVLTKSFARNDGGNVAMIFALTLIPLILMGGFAIDAQQAFSKKGKVQHAADSAVLAGARMMQSVNDETKVTRHARDYFEAMIETGLADLTCDLLTVRFTGPEEVTTTTTCRQPTTLMRITGRDYVEFSVSSTATYGTGRVDVAFVFDVSGSMNSHNRIWELKNAAKEAADTLLPEPGSVSEGDVRIAMIGYNAMVNAGDYFSDVTGLESERTYYAEDTYAGPGNCERICTWSWRSYCFRWENFCPAERDTEVELESTCVFERDGDHAFTNRVPKLLKPWDLLDRVQSGTYNARDDSRNSDAYMTANHAVFDDNGYNYGSWSVEGKTGLTGSDLCPSVEPFPLSHDERQINNYINSLRAEGGTAGHQGIAWGWYLISHEWSSVFTGSGAPLDPREPDVVKAMIVMTDGEFNQQFHGSLGNSNQQAKQLCDAIKDDDVIVYAVAFQAPQAGKDILKECSSGPEFFFNADNGQELVESYNAIATSISDLRISQ